MRVRYKNHSYKGELIDGFMATKHPLYRVYNSMRSRCYNPKCPHYCNYGARGITVCDRWDVFVNFVADMGRKPAGRFTLERKNNNLGYSPDNCVWASPSDQCLNRRTFKNNVVGMRGVHPVKDRFNARMDFEGVRYELGRFATPELAAQRREEFETLFKVDRTAAIATIVDETLWCTSSTKVRGVTVHPDGGFLARVTVSKVRIYLGYFKTIGEAEDAIKRHNSN